MQSIDGYVSPDGIQFCAELLDLSTAEVSAVATFYTQYKRRPNGEYQVGVCTNTLCAVMGGDEIWRQVSERAGVGHDETTAERQDLARAPRVQRRVRLRAGDDGQLGVLRQHDARTRRSQLVDDILGGKDVEPTRGADKVVSFKEVSRVLAGFRTAAPTRVVTPGAPTLAGIETAKQQGWKGQDK